MNFSIECEEELDGRWIAEVPQLPGVLCYGTTAEEAMAKAEVLALRTMKNSSRYCDPYAQAGGSRGLRACGAPPVTFTLEHSISPYGFLYGLVLLCIHGNNSL